MKMPTTKLDRNSESAGKIKTAFYGCIYNDEYEPETYRAFIERQFNKCAIRAKMKKYQIVAWYFDVLIDNPIAKFEVEAFVEECGRKYFPDAQRTPDVKPV